MEWISVEDRLPDKYVDVLVWYEYFRYGEYNRMYQTHGIGYQVNGDWHVLCGGSRIEVFAWMPLPEPPKMEVENGQ